jgi:hypothetical protein
MTLRGNDVTANACLPEADAAQVLVRLYTRIYTHTHIQAHPCAHTQAHTLKRIQLALLFVIGCPLMYFVFVLLFVVVLVAFLLAAERKMCSFNVVKESWNPNYLGVSHPPYNKSFAFRR